MEEEEEKPKPLDARAALESGNETARFCLYKEDSHGIVHPRMLGAKAAIDAMEDGWRDNPADARKDVEGAADAVLYVVAAAAPAEEPPKVQDREESIKKAVKPRRSRAKKKAPK